VVKKCTPADKILATPMLPWTGAVGVISQITAACWWCGHSGLHQSTKFKTFCTQNRHLKPHHYITSCPGNDCTMGTLNVLKACDAWADMGQCPVRLHYSAEYRLCSISTASDLQQSSYGVLRLQHFGGRNWDTQLKGEAVSRLTKGEGAALQHVERRRLVNRNRDKKGEEGNGRSHNVCNFASPYKNPG